MTIIAQLEEALSQMTGENKAVYEVARETAIAELAKAMEIRGALDGQIEARLMLVRTLEAKLGIKPEQSAFPPVTPSRFVRRRRRATK